MLFYIGMGMQLIGFTSVGLCLFAGLDKGDYGQLELIQLFAGAILFYVGQIIKVKGAGQ
jgi:hypothetical protein